MKLGLITINYNNQKDTQELVKGLNKQTDKNFILFIADHSDKQPLKLSVEDNVIIKCFENNGYSAGVNKGLAYFASKGIKQYVVINNDIRVTKDFTARIKESFKWFKVFGAKIYYEKGFEYHKKYSKDQLGKVLWYAGGWFDWKNAYVNHRGVDRVESDEFNVVEETEFITGCFFAFDKDVFSQVGFWDERYFLYYEDADYSLRVKKANFYLIYNPEVFLYHKNAQSTDGSGSLFHQKIQRESRFRFALKYAPLKTKLHIIKNYYLYRK
ncbi:MAG: glycosyl transferase [Patescibacteria group bacterium]|nr:MAG: glycosyl transferase [Patescibacteria group bacterium]